MRLLFELEGRPALVALSATRTYSVPDIAALMDRLLGQRRRLSLDFSGECVPICDVQDIPLAAALVTAYHNSLVRGNIQVMRI